MHVGIFGGSFDPFHSGHMTLIRSALSAGRLDHLVVIPAGSPPHKDSTRMTPAAHRYFMTAAALAGEPGVSVSDAEMSREGPTYTIDTLRSLRGRFGPDATLYLVVGADIVFDIRSWRFPDQVFAESVLYLAMRPGFRRADVEARANELRAHFGARIEVFDADTPDVSATALREALRTGCLEAERTVYSIRNTLKRLLRARLVNLPVLTANYVYASRIAGWKNLIPVEPGAENRPE